MVAVLVGACGDDASDEAGDVSSASAEDGPELTSDASQTDGSTGGTGMSSTTTESTSTATSGATTTSTTATSETTGSTGADDSTGFGTDTGGTAVDSCAECAADELCVELTEYAGPADGGGPAVSYTCHVPPGGCGDTITCECAGHLCPGDDFGGRGSCQTDGDVLYCSISYP